MYNLYNNFIQCSIKSLLCGLLHEFFKKIRVKTWHRNIILITFFEVVYFAIAVYQVIQRFGCFTVENFIE